MGRKYGKWFSGNIYKMSSKQMVRTRKYGEDVIKPHALETKVMKGKEYSRYYHKPLYPGELD